MDLPRSQLYYNNLMQIERLHRLFLEIVKLEIDRMGIRDVSNVQAMILYNIGDQKITVGELTIRGYYIGTNVTYNLRKMVEAGYLIQERSEQDRRSSYVYVSPKGLALIEQINKIFAQHQEKLAGFSVDPQDLAALYESLTKLERGLYRLSLMANRPLDDT